MREEYYFLDNDVITIRDMHCTYNGVGSLTRDKGRGIALIEYDDTNNPKRKVYLPWRAEIH